MGRRSCRDASLRRTAQGTRLPKEPGDAGSEKRTQRRILRVWVAGFSGDVGHGFCVAKLEENARSARLFGCFEVLTFLAMPLRLEWHSHPAA